MPFFVETKIATAPTEQDTFYASATYNINVQNKLSPRRAEERFLLCWDYIITEHTKTGHSRPACVFVLHINVVGGAGIKSILLRRSSSYLWLRSNFMNYVNQSYSGQLITHNKLSRHLKHRAKAERGLNLGNVGGPRRWCYEQLRK